MRAAVAGALDRSRSLLLARTRTWFDEGKLFDQIARRVAYRTESQDKAQAPVLRGYLEDEIVPSLAALGAQARVVENPVDGAPPFVIGERIEAAGLPTVLMYAHGDVVLGYDDQWQPGRSPWSLHAEGDRWYGRGCADNKGQHSINLAALEQVLALRGRLGFNLRFLFEMGEEIGSPGLRLLCERERGRLAADVLIASDGPRLIAQRPTLFLGSRGAFNFDLVVDLRDGAHHSGNWGGLLSNPGTVLANAIASLVDQRGVIRIEGLRPPPLDAAVRRALRDVEPGEPGGPVVELEWGEPGLTPAERVVGWNALEVLAFKTGNPEHPVNAIPASARAHLQLRFVVGCEPEGFVAALRAHLDRHGFAAVQVAAARDTVMRATRLSPEHPWVTRVAASIATTTGTAPVILPNLGGSLPNDCFAEVLGLPTVWIPHSYPACSQHAPNEHLLASVAREALALMAGVYWDIGAGVDPSQ